jgi:hypothetical protein
LERAGILDLDQNSVSGEQIGYSRTIIVVLLALLQISSSETTQMRLRRNGLGIFGHQSNAAVLANQHADATDSRLARSCDSSAMSAKSSFIRAWRRGMFIHEFRIIVPRVGHFISWFAPCTASLCLLMEREQNVFMLLVPAKNLFELLPVSSPKRLPAILCVMEPVFWNLLLVSICEMGLAPKMKIENKNGSANHTWACLSASMLNMYL